MKPRTLPPLALLLTLLATVPANGATVSRVTDLGRDGKHYYTVACSDGSRASIVVAESPRSICIVADHLGRSCRPDWTVDNAAAFACRTAPPRPAAP
ncbi:MAG: hypothetical protein KA217_02580 [Gammaproteobacteria bacterium]|nr:hypothetical protein [Gammaproteobacteria bacterium]